MLEDVLFQQFLDGIRNFIPAWKQFQPVSWNGCAWRRYHAGLEPFWRNQAQRRRY